MTTPHEAPAAASAMLSEAELTELLNTLLEAERAGARVLAVFLDDHAADSDTWLQLRRVQRDEARNCAILVRLITALGAVPSKATGDFLGKALAVQGGTERLAFLNRGQSWVVRVLRDHLQRVAEGPVRLALQDMLDSHIANIATCEALITPALEPPSGG